MKPQKMPLLNLRASYNAVVGGHVDTSDQPRQLLDELLE
jgi:hypothetical protein